MTFRQETTDEIIKRLGLKTLKESLNKTIFLLSFGGFKSMQKVFDETFDEITEARKYRSWQRITDCLNEQTTHNLSVLTVKTMYKRAKKKRENNKTE
ncbi:MULTISPECIES: hypothetical protein [Enterobacterales]|uniref:Uncharacterized protein n=1 Tax=Klebsiella pneumoniae subsp. pneumoniae TaxID=72407 RepID=A0ACC7Q7G8_KLEPN|nr:MULTISPECIES: hypothetical protein [Enterobacterales]HCE8950735.1 hypothetical protein [Morganella morganii]MDC9758406.1 hypothetical protein [Proteus mirabilis]MDC9772538.1 hypothetical protein [Proteus mirabilis]MDS0002911.1 hypothetical protein [Enterobacter hormaechei subsp. xiangfangensis]HCE8950881.1 hypothetical protein [Morganella morganii]